MTLKLKLRDLVKYLLAVKAEIKYTYLHFLWNFKIYIYHTCSIIRNANGHK